jgi:hypothetical protein
MWCHSQAIFPAKFESLSSGVRPYIVRMNDETRARSSWTILQKQLQNHIDVIAGIKLLTFWNRVDKMETLWIPNDCDYHFAILNHVFHFQGVSNPIELKQFCGSSINKTTTHPRS